MHSSQTDEISQKDLKDITTLGTVSETAQEIFSAYYNGLDDWLDEAHT